MTKNKCTALLNTYKNSQHQDELCVCFENKGKKICSCQGRLCQDCSNKLYKCRKEKDVDIYVPAKILQNLHKMSHCIKNKIF